MKKLKEDYGGQGGNYPQHDYHRDSRHAFGTRYYAQAEPSRGLGRSGWVLALVVVAALVFVARSFMLGQ